MSIHIERCHHRTTVKRGRRDWRARCNHCGFSQSAARWRDAFRIALRHADGSLR